MLFLSFKTPFQLQTYQSFILLFYKLYLPEVEYRNLSSVEQFWLWEEKQIMNYNEKIKFWASLEGFLGVGGLYVGF